MIDTGVDATHPDLTGQVLPGASFVPGAPTAADDNGHGTHVSGIIAAATNNGVGVRGAAPGVKILPIKALNSGGSGSYSTVATAIYSAVDQGAKVINMSLGGTVASTVFDAAVAYANAHGVTVVAAAGNDGARGNPASYPGSTPGVVAVGAVDSTLTRASFSTCGAYVDIAAPAVGTSPGTERRWRRRMSPPPRPSSRPPTRHAPRPRSKPRWRTGRRIEVRPDATTSTVLV